MYRHQNSASHAALTPRMRALNLRAFAALALLCFALPRAEAVSINFSGIITEISVAQNPASPPHEPRFSPFSVGAPFTGQFSYAVPITPLSMTISIAIGGGELLAIGSLPPSFDGNSSVIQAGAFSGVGSVSVGITLNDPMGQMSGSFTYIDRAGFMGDVITVRGVIGAVSDDGSAAMLLAIGFCALVLYRRKALSFPVE